MSTDRSVPYDPRDESRRPGFRALCDEIAAKHPTWDARRVEAEAKTEWHRRQEKTP